MAATAPWVLMQGDVMTQPDGKEVGEVGVVARAWGRRSSWGVANVSLAGQHRHMDTRSEDLNSRLQVITATLSCYVIVTDESRGSKVWQPNQFICIYSAIALTRQLFTSSNTGTV